MAVAHAHRRLFIGGVGFELRCAWCSGEGRRDQVAAHVGPSDVVRRRREAASSRAREVRPWLPRRVERVPHGGDGTSTLSRSTSVTGSVRPGLTACCTVATERHRLKAVWVGEPLGKLHARVATFRTPTDCCLDPSKHDRCGFRQMWRGESEFDVRQKRWLGYIAGDCGFTGETFAAQGSFDYLDGALLTSWSQWVRATHLCPVIPSAKSGAALKAMACLVAGSWRWRSHLAFCAVLIALR